MNTTVGKHQSGSQAEQEQSKKIANSFDLSKEQQAVVDQISNSSDHFFITGEAGTGKSYVLQYLKTSLDKNLVVVAPTGVAALVVGGQTIHSLLLLPPTLIQPAAIRLNKTTRELLSQLKVLIIDEISMVRADLMDAIDIALRLAKHSRQPFGGVQIIMFGDPYQLPPIVHDPESVRYFSTEYDGPYFFQAHVWHRDTFKTIELTHVFRQKEEHLVAVLNAIRSGSVGAELLNTLNRRVGMFTEDESALTLTATNNRSAQINNYFLAQISAKSHSYQATVTGRLDPKMFPAEYQLVLKPGAQIMMLRNDTEKRWVNGSLGKVVRLIKSGMVILIDGQEHEVTSETWNRIRYKLDKDSGELREEIISTFTQFPLRLAWAVTIHKSQGQTFDKVTIDLERGAFAHGQTYVALSRCRTLGGMSLTRAIEERDVIVDPVITQFMNGEYTHPNQLF